MASGITRLFFKQIPIGFDGDSHAMPESTKFDPSDAERRSKNLTAGPRRVSYRAEVIGAGPGVRRFM